MRNLDPYKRTVRGVGFIGEGEYDSLTYGRKPYYLWQSMLTRCYSKAEQQRSRTATYIGCEVEPRWHNFQNFCKDIFKMPNWNSSDFCFDKDGRVFHNRVYGPKYCSFLPAHINVVIASLFSYTGVTLHKGRWIARMSIDGVLTNLGSFDTEKQAMKEYGIVKTEYVRRLAKEYREDIHKQVFRNLRNYTCQP